MESMRTLRILGVSLLLLFVFHPALPASAQSDLVLTIGTGQAATGPGEIMVVATLTDGTGTPLQGQEVFFTSTMGSLYPASAVTDNNGEAQVTYYTGDQPGVSTITASFGSVTASLVVTVKKDTTTQWIVNIVILLLGGLGVLLYLRKKKVRESTTGEAARISAAQQPERPDEQDVFQTK